MLLVIAMTLALLFQPSRNVAVLGFLCQYIAVLMYLELSSFEVRCLGMSDCMFVLAERSKVPECFILVFLSPYLSRFAAQNALFGSFRLWFFVS